MIVQFTNTKGQSVFVSADCPIFAVEQESDGVCAVVAGDMVRFNVKGDACEIVKKIIDAKSGKKPVKVLDCTLPPPAPEGGEIVQRKAAQSPA